METAIQLIQHIAWPLTILGISLMFRSELRSAMGRLSHLKYGDWEATFEKGLRVAERHAEEAIASTDGEDKPVLTGSAPQMERLSWLAELSPRSAVVEAWFDVERAVREAAERLPIIEHERRTTSKIMKKLRQMGIVNDAALTVYSQLGSLRNQAVHAPEFAVSPGEAERFLELASELATRIRRVSAE